MNFKNFKCSNSSKVFKFSGGYEENKEALKFLEGLIAKFNCEDLSKMYCCINDFVLHNFCKSNNYTVVNREAKLKICKELQGILKDLSERIYLSECNLPDCINKHSSI